MSGPVQVTLTFTSIALAVAALAKLDPVGIIVSGNPPSEGNVGAAGATDAPAPAQTGHSGFQCNEARSCLHPGGSISPRHDGNFGIHWFGTGR
jgi:hypothetical protein